MSVTTLLHPLSWRRQLLSQQGDIPKPTVKNKERLYLLEEETRNSIMIEGYFVDKQEISGTIAQNRKHPHKHIDQILGYFDAASLMYEFAYQKYLSKEKFQLTHTDIRTIHSLMFRGQNKAMPGQYRVGDIVINQATIKPPYGLLVQDAMDEFLKYTNTLSFDETSLFVSLAKFHSYFESTHPFVDGNGRVGRVLINYILVAHGYPTIIIKGTQSEKERYFDGLEQAEQGLLDYYPSALPKASWSNNSSFQILSSLFQENLFESLDYIILGQSKQILRPVAEIMKERGLSSDYARQLIKRGKVIAKKVGTAWYSHPDFMM